MFDNLLKKNLYSSFFYKALLLLLNFIFISLFINISGVDKYGEYVLYLSLINIGLIANDGINNAFVKYIGENKKNNNKLQSVYATLMVAGGLYIGIIIISFAIFYKYIFQFINISHISVEYIILIIFIFINMFLNSNFSAIMNGFEKVYITNKAEGILNILKVIFSIVLLYFYSVLGALLGLLIAVFVSNIFLFYKLQKETPLMLFKQTVYSYKTLMKILNFSVVTSGNALIWRIFSNIDKILISKFLGQEAVGFYNIAVSVAVRVWEVSALFSRVAYPRFLSLKYSIKELYKIYFKLQLINISIISIIVTILWLFSKDIISIWINENTALNSFSLLNTMLIGVLFGASNYLNALILFVYDMHKIVFLNTLIGFLVYLIIVFYFENLSLSIFASAFSFYFIVSSILNWIYIKNIFEKRRFNVTRQ